MKKILIHSILIISLQIGYAQKGYQPTPENLAARAWFEDAKFGMFIHWGVYSVLGDGEWVMNTQKIAIKEYEKLPSFFNPTAYNPEEWVRMAKDAGMKYITITSRHHDGFSMFDSKASDYTIVKKSPYGKDILKPLAEACRKEGIKLFFYYSLLDWHDDNYFPRGNTGTQIPGRSKKGEWDKYIAFMKTQLTELLTNYGDIAGIWFDGHWDQKNNINKTIDWHCDELYSLIHKLQPAALIGNNHHIAPIEGEDFQMFEKDLPGKNTTGWATSESDIGKLPKEVCETINGSWGFNLKDRRHKTNRELIRYIVNAAGYGSNLLLNVGPMPNGMIQPKHVESLKSIGEWMKINGETVYGTKKGPVFPTKEMVSTKKGNTVYLHVLNEQQRLLFVEGFKGKISSIKFFKDKEKATYKLDKYGLFIEIPEHQKNTIDCIIEITLK